MLHFTGSRNSRMDSGAVVMFVAVPKCGHIEKLIEKPATGTALRRMLRSGRHIEFLRRNIDLRDRPGGLLDPHLAS
jgi:hypothetical protein